MTLRRAAPQPLCVLHLSADYPDANRAETTLAVRNFIQACRGLDHFVVSLNRVALPWQVNCIDGDGRGDPQVVSMRYWGLPGGILLGLSMTIVAWRVCRQLRRRGLQVQMVHAHKLCFEGLAAWWLNRWLRLPYVVSVRGEAESKVFRFKPHYRPWLCRVVRQARQVYYVSAWFKPTLERHCQPDPDRERLLPNFVAERDRHPSGVWRRDHLVTVMDVNVFRKKGLDRLLPAFKTLLASVKDAQLDVIGRGSPEVMAEVSGLIEDLQLGAHVRLCGPMPNEELLARLPAYAAFVLPSHNETFGMSYVEALLAGVPILYSKGTGIDGFVDDVSAACAVDPCSEEAIAQGMLRMLCAQEENRTALARQVPELKNRFSSRAHVEQYLQVVRHACEASTRPLEMAQEGRIP